MILFLKIFFKISKKGIAFSKKLCYNNRATYEYAGVMELVDVLDSKSCGSDTVSVRPRSPAPKKRAIRLVFLFYFLLSLFIRTYTPTRATTDIPSTKYIAVCETALSKK